LTDRRSEPHVRTFICNNPDFEPRHTFSIFPGDLRYFDHDGEKVVYMCNVEIGRRVDGSPVVCRGRLLSRRTTKGIRDYPPPKELLRTLEENMGWAYDAIRATPEEIAAWRLRDRALVSLLYLGMLRVSEGLRLRRGQFEIEENVVKLHNVQLVKRKPTNPEWRELVNLPMHGPRAPFTQFIIEQIEPIKDPEAFVFPGYSDRHLGRGRAWSIVSTLTGKFNHAFRAFGEDYMAHQPGVILIDLAAYVKVNPAILSTYIHSGSSLPIA
jgi:integrase